MAEKSKCSIEQEQLRQSAAAQLVCDINAVGAVLLIDHDLRALRVCRGRNLTPELRERLLGELEPVIAFLYIEAQEEAS